MSEKYTKETFEQGLQDLGALPHLTPLQLGEVARGPFNPLAPLTGGRPLDGVDAIVIDGAVSGGVAVLRKYWETDEMSSYIRDKQDRFDNRVEVIGGADSKRGNQSTEQLRITTDSGPGISFMNAYDLITYWPDGDDGRGDAARYVIRDPSWYRFGEEISGWSGQSTISEEAAIETVLSDAYYLDAEHSIFMSAIELRRLYANGFPPNSPDTDDSRKFSNYTHKQTPYVSFEIDPYKEIDAIRPNPDPISHGGMYINRALFSGWATAEIKGGATPLWFDEETGTLRSLKLANSVTKFSEDDPLVFEPPILQTRKPMNTYDLLSMLPRPTGKYGATVAPKLVGSLSVGEAVKRGILQTAREYSEPVSAVRIVHKAITNTRKSRYLTELLNNNKPHIPESDVTRLVEDILNRSLEQWSYFLRSDMAVWDGVQLEPSSQGLDRVARVSGIFSGSRR